MNTSFLRKSVFSFLGLASLAVISNGNSAVAETVNQVPRISNQVDLQVSNPQGEFNWDENKPQISSPEMIVPISEAFSSNQKSLQPLSTQGSLKKEQISQTINPKNQIDIVTPIPGTVSTSSVVLQSLEENSKEVENNSEKKLAQADIGIGRATRGGSSYIGIGANIGLDGTSALGDGNFIVISKVGLTKKISLRPAAVLGDDTMFLVPLTYDFSLNAADPFTEPLPIAPYIGAGAAIETGDDSETAFLVTGGVDVPLNSQFTANAAISAAFFDDTDIGLMLGVGYNFKGL
ncbi:MAG: hypothetical protein QNJ49_01630 [Mastigocoleus sp. MO_167.B18]|uniref:hypothetical protein n=1 Tax=Mastigocoleus sp. MO_188.B34 TaxID=3036635 RepID=UPI00261235D1|nr:hypothetical protein [Mastigocoleus sp. MO_188.B34]MDJ0697184.1 hypothetical protein [Mastigocoleus sp. MO_188.B34]MDJ0772115.1 hypothetical protein [Mastigocoleus sp. MO_167.B18]